MHPLMPEKKPRPLFEYDVPEELDQSTAEHPVKKLVFKQLNGHEEQLAAKLSKGDAIDGAFTSIIMSIAAVDDRACSMGDGSAEREWKNMPPQVRQLALAAYHHLHMPKEEQAKAFLKSQKVKLSAG